MTTPTYELIVQYAEKLGVAKDWVDNYLANVRKLTLEELYALRRAQSEIWLTHDDEDRSVRAGLRVDIIDEAKREKYKEFHESP